MAKSENKKSSHKQEDRLLKSLEKISDKKIRDDILHIIHNEIIEHPQAFIHILDNTGEFLFINKSMQDLETEEVTGMPFTDNKWEVCEPCMTSFRRIFSEGLKGKTVTEKVVMHSGKNRNRNRIFNLLVKPVFKNESVAYLIGISYEITHLEEIEKLKNAKRLFEEQVKDLVVTRVRIPEGTCEYISPSFKTVFGWEVEEGMEGFSFFVSKLHPDYVENIRIKWAKLLDGEFPREDTFKMLTKDEGYRWFHQTNSGLYDKDGNLIAIECVTKDITEQNILEKKIKDLEEKFEIILHEGKIALFTVVYGEKKEDILTRSKYFFSEGIKNITGYDAKDFLIDHERLIKIIHADDFNKVIDTYYRQLEEEGEINLVYRCMRKDGFVCKVKVWGKIFRNEEGKPIRGEYILMDISDKDVYDELLDYFARRIAEDEMKKRKSGEQSYIR
jgi:PAS domain S-box-containing protein